MTPLSPHNYYFPYMGGGIPPHYHDGLSRPPLNFSGPTLPYLSGEIVPYILVGAFLHIALLNFIPFYFTSLHQKFSLSNLLPLIVHPRSHSYHSYQPSPLSPTVNFPYWWSYSIPVIWINNSIGCQKDILFVLWCLVKINYQ